MNQRVVIADAGPLIALARIDSLALLRGLFGRVRITATIRDEVLPSRGGHPELDLLARTLREGWIEVVDVPGGDWRPINPGVDAGEAGAIRMACRWRDQGDAVLLIIDDRVGRLEARAHGIAVTGTAAVIGLARTEGLIREARPLLQRLVQTGYYLAPPVIAAVLAAIGE